MEDKLILLTRKGPLEYEVHRYEVNQSKNLILITGDKAFAQQLVNGYNSLCEKSISQYRCSRCQKTVEREDQRQWIKSYCGQTQQYTRLTKLKSQ